MVSIGIVWVCELPSNWETITLRRAFLEIGRDPHFSFWHTRPAASHRTGRADRAPAAGWFRVGRIARRDAAEDVRLPLLVVVEANITDRSARVPSLDATSVTLSQHSLGLMGGRRRDG